MARQQAATSWAAPRGGPGLRPWLPAPWCPVPARLAPSPRSASRAPIATPALGQRALNVQQHPASLPRQPGNDTMSKRFSILFSDGGTWARAQAPALLGARPLPALPPSFSSHTRLLCLLCCWSTHTFQAAIQDTPRGEELTTSWGHCPCAPCRRLRPS